jgi:asparaginyl-tRNA synthetase
MTKVAETSQAIALPKQLDELTVAELKRKQQIAKVTTSVLRYLSGEFIDEGFDWLLPVVFSKSTDPLWPDPGASIEKRVEAEIYGETVRTTLSMIIHKIVACSLAYPKLFVLSPNVRIEKRKRKVTGWHAFEFTQLDFEMRGATFKDVRGLVEKVISGVVRDVKNRAKDELVSLKRFGTLTVPETPFKVYDREDLEKKYGRQWETRLPEEIDGPTWVMNIPREFYDFQNLGDGKWDNYDLFLPKYGEVLSGARREWEYSKITSKIERDGVKKENYALILRLAKEGRLKPCAGAGIGIERLIRWITGVDHIGEVQPFPKVPGLVYDL